MLALGLVLLLQANTFLYNDPDADKLIRQAMATTYNLRLAEARASAKALQERYPDHPAGYTLMAETSWWEAQMDPGNAAIEKTYESSQKLAVQKGETALKLPKYARIEVSAYLGSAWGSYARFQVTQRGAYFSALRAGLKAHGYAEEVYKMDPNYWDIYVGIGAFNYFSGSLPAVIKPFAWLFGARGDRDLGIQQLKTAIARARYSQTEARIVYYTAMLEDKNWAEGFRMLEQLRRDYPDNSVIYTWITDWYRQQKKNLAGADYFEKVYNEEVKRAPLQAKYALLEKVQLLDAEWHRDEAILTLDRLKGIPATDLWMPKKIQTWERSLRK